MKSKRKTVQATTRPAAGENMISRRLSLYLKSKEGIVSDQRGNQENTGLL